MTQKSELLSALMDGESQDKRSIDTVIDDAEAMGTWQRYHLIRDGLRKELPEQLDFDISAKVAEALEQESAIVAPKSSVTSKLPILGQVIPLVRQAGQFAIAASVAAVMIIGVQTLNTPQPDQPFNAAPVPQIPGISGGLSPVSLEQTRALPQTDVMEHRRRVNAYFTDHQQQLRLKAELVRQQNNLKDKTSEETPEPE